MFLMPAENLRYKSQQGILETQTCQSSVRGPVFAGEPLLDSVSAVLPVERYGLPCQPQYLFCLFLLHKLSHTFNHPYCLSPKWQRNIFILKRKEEERIWCDRDRNYALYGGFKHTRMVYASLLHPLVLGLASSIFLNHFSWLSFVLLGC